MKDIRVGYIHKWDNSNSINIYQNQPRFTDGRLDNDFIKVKITIEGLDAFCEPAKCEHEWSMFSGTGLNGQGIFNYYTCQKCGEIKTEQINSQPQKPKINVLGNLERYDFAGQLIINKINELIKAVNGLYERR